MNALFEECCKIATDIVEQEIINWHGGRYILPRQACSLLARKYPLGAFKIVMVFDLLFPLFCSTSHYSNRISLSNGEYELLRDKYELDSFFEKEYHNYRDGQNKEKMMKDLHDKLLIYCMDIIRETCEFGG